MPKTHPTSTARIVYRIKPASVWRAIRAEWEAGAAPVELGRRFDVSASSVQARRDREGWCREGAMGRVVGGAGGALAVGGGAAAGAVEGEGVERRLDALAVNEVALAAAMRALERGRPGDAVALVRAADLVGGFAEYVAHMRIEIAEEEEWLAAGAPVREGEVAPLERGAGAQPGPGDGAPGPAGVIGRTGGGEPGPPGALRPERVAASEPEELEPAAPEGVEAARSRRILEGLAGGGVGVEVAGPAPKTDAGLWLEGAL